MLLVKLVWLTSDLDALGDTQMNNSEPALHSY